MTSFSFESVNSALLQTLECPVCLDYMTAPIKLCKNGHNICSSCKSKQDNCPTCREEFSSVRPLALEQLCEAAFFPCENKEAGCEVKLLIADKQEHAIKCPYRMYECIAGAVGPCGWKGRKTELLDHVEQNHPKCVWTGETQDCTWKLSGESEVDNMVFQAHGELFWELGKVDEDEQKIYFAVQYIGSQEKAKEYTYEYKFEMEGRPESLFFRFLTHEDTDTINNIFSSCRCVSLDLEFIDPFCIDDTLEYSFSVKKFPPCL